MSDKQSVNVAKNDSEAPKEPQLKKSDTDPAPECCSDKKDTTTTSEKTFEDKAINVDMDCEPGDDPKKNKKYWQDVAGFKGAREQYLQLDVLDLRAEQYRLSDYIKYLKETLNRALKENVALKARRCRCDEESEREVLKTKSVSSIGL